MIDSVAWAALGTGFTFLMTALGAALVFFFRGAVSDSFSRVSMGFASGVMLAAGIWSLLLPAMETAAGQGQPGFLVASVGSLSGALGMLLTDHLVSLLRSRIRKNSADKAWKRTAMLVFAVTLHNLPEGMAVGLAFALSAGADEAAFAGAVALAVGIGVQNLPEGAAISLPMRRSGRGVWRSFACGGLSGAVEPIFGVLAVLAAGTAVRLNPWLMAFAAGAMFWTVFQELLPDALEKGKRMPGAAGLAAGFLLMMLLDILLGS